MSVERNLLISLLKTTKEGSVLLENVKLDAKLPTETALFLLEKLQSEGFINFHHDRIDVDSTDRMKLAVKAVSLGGDIEQISHLLCWQEFESIAAVALSNHGYVVKKNVRFTQGGRRWEIDVVGCQKPLVVCVDCKHWQHTIVPSAIKKMATEQAQRTHALGDFLPNTQLHLECTKWENAKFVPMVLSLMPGADKFYNQIPIVSILQIQDFIHQLPAYIPDVKYYPKRFSRLSHDF